MRRSIKWKITSTFIIVIACCLVSVLLFNVLFLEKLYINNKKEILKKTYQALDSGIIEAYNNGYDLSDLFNRTPRAKSGEFDTNFTLFLRELLESYNVSIILMDKNNVTYSLYQNSSRFERRIFRYIFQNIEEDKGIKILEKTNNYTITINNHINDIINDIPINRDNDNIDNEGPGAIIENQKRRQSVMLMNDRNADIENFGFLSDKNTAFFMFIPISSIKEPIYLFNHILVVVLLVITIFGSIAVYLISCNITNPLLKLSQISKKMSRLEFEYKYDDNRNDEIGILGNSMNELSNKLEKAIKELKNANFKLKNDLEKKEQLDVMRQEFVANVSHELKTPIAIIEGYAEGLEDSNITNDDDKRKYYISVIKDEIMKMNHLVMQILDLSSLERGVTDINIERINLKDVVDGLLRAQEITISKSNANIITDISSDVFVWADGYKLEEIIRNYLTNALNHISDRKIIKLYTENISDDKIRLCIYNSGVKLSEAECNKIWEKFYKVDKARTREYGGTGLGLSIVKSIADKLNTTCGCYSVDKNDILDDGMIFYFDFYIK